MGGARDTTEERGGSTEQIPSLRDLLPSCVRMVVTDGPDRGREFTLQRGVFAVGKAEDCDQVLSDSTVSRRHLEVTVRPRDVLCRDLGSTNGSFFNGARFDAIELPLGARVTIGMTTLAFVPLGVQAPPPVSGASAFGDLIGKSTAMREVFAACERAAATDLPVLITGETGVGKEVCAQALHAASARRDGPFVVCDLAGLSRTVIERELFGHVRGAFTGADHDRPGAFVAAAGGTILLDEIAELDLEFQPRLLRAIDRREVKPVGEPKHRRVDVRVVAATQKVLEAEVEAGRFRRDLFQRVEAFHVRIPPLRTRKEDIPLLARHFVDAFAPGRAVQIPPETIAALTDYEWPGNVRELRHAVERALATAPEDPVLYAHLLGIGSRTPAIDSRRDARLSFREAKERLVSAWEREYLAGLLRKTSGNVSEVSRLSGIDRGHLYRLLKKHGLIE
jgi:DNA-binding NtrC family response regulator